jgi:hypothetical protein
MVDEIRVVEEDDTNNFQMLPADLARASPKTYNHVIPLDVAGSRPRLGALAPEVFWLRLSIVARDLGRLPLMRSYICIVQLYRGSSARRGQLNGWRMVWRPLIANSQLSVISGVIGTSLFPNPRCPLFQGLIVILLAPCISSTLSGNCCLSRGDSGCAS